MTSPATLTDAARRILDTPEPADKVRLTYKFSGMWRTGALERVGDTPPPIRPARPTRPELRRPGDMPQRSKGGVKGRIALVHAIAHIELNAIDLAWDIIARFSSPDLPRAFFDDWVQVAEDEARHFEMLEQRLSDMDAAYGDLPAHDGLWEAATDTADDLAARLALVPMLLEARGLDTTPATVARLEKNGDAATAAIMAEIGADEVGHVAAGVRWFEHVCAHHGQDPVATFHALVEARFKGQLKPPFNVEARESAGMAQAYYDPALETHPSHG